MSKVSLLPIAFRRHWVFALAALASVIGSSLLYVKVTPSVYQSSGRLMLDEQRTGVSDLSRNLAQLPDSRASGANPVITQAELLKSQRVLERAIDLYESDSAVDSVTNNITPSQLRGGLDVAIVPGTNILQLTYQDEDPERAARLLNAVLRSTVDESAETIRAEASTVRAFLEVEVPRQRARLEQAEANENAYRREVGIISLEEQKQALIGSLADVQQEERQVASNLQEVVTRSQYLQQITGNQALGSAYASIRAGQDERLQNLRAELAEVEAQVIQAQSRLGAQHPDLLALLDQREAKRQAYNEALTQVIPSGQAISPNQIALDETSQELTSDYIVGEISREALEDRLSLIQGVRSNLENQVKQLPIKEQRLAILMRQREEAEATLQLLQTQLEEARLAEAQLVSNVSIIDLAKPSNSPAWPNIPAILIIATAAGLGLAVAVMILLEALNNHFEDVVELEEMMRPKVPVLAALPKFPSENIQLQYIEPFIKSPNLIEPYRSLAEVLNLSSKAAPKVVVVTSTIDGEGKSTVASHLAVAASYGSKRTLLIDANLQEPKQHEIFGISPQPGLSDVVHESCSLSEATQTTSNNFLSVLPFGGITPQHPCLSEAFNALISKASEQYDLIIVDSPSIVRSADSMALAKHSDGILLVARPKYTPKGDLRHVAKNLASTGLPFLGIVVNGARESFRSFQGLDFYTQADSESAVNANGSRELAKTDLSK